jgi:hypothetical protein
MLVGCSFKLALELINHFDAFTFGLDILFDRPATGTVWISGVWIGLAQPSGADV